MSSVYPWSYYITSGSIAPTFLCGVALSIPILPGGITPHGWPIGVLGDIQILGVHYHSYDDLSQSWERRRKRVNFDNIFLIATDEYIKTPQDIEAFSKLPYPKVLFKSNNTINCDFEIYIPGSDKRDNVGDLLRYAVVSGIRLFEKYFDFIGWLNSNSEYNKSDTGKDEKPE